MRPSGETHFICAGDPHSLAQPAQDQRNTPMDVKIWALIALMTAIVFFAEYRPAESAREKRMGQP
jgi:hypothetical protein